MSGNHIPCSFRTLGGSAIPENILKDKSTNQGRRTIFPHQRYVAPVCTSSPFFWMLRMQLGIVVIACWVTTKCFWRRYKGQIFHDPLRRALDRGSKGLDLINSPLVLDYVHVRFTGTLPPWTSRNPFQPTINEGETRFFGCLSAANFTVYWYCVPVSAQ